MRRASDGFTVLELLVVLGIVGVLCVVGEVSTGMLRRHSVVTSCKRAVAEIETSAEIVRARTASYPGRVDGNDAAANPLLVGSGTLSRWPKGSGFALVWTGDHVDVVTTASSHNLGAGPGACESLHG